VSKAGFARIWLNYALLLTNTVLVQFSLCMMQDKRDGKTKRVVGREFSYTTLFEMKVQDLVKSSYSALTRAANSRGQGGRPAPLACRFHRIPTHVPLNLHTICWKLPTDDPVD
jgi:hypothetical protein